MCGRPAAVAAAGRKLVLQTAQASRQLFVPMSQLTQRDRFIQNLLPWTIAGVMLLFYLLTMGHTFTLANLPILAELSHWTWPQNSLPPITFLVTYPLRWLAPSGMVLGLGVFSAVCGALTLGLLARAVALLPHDRTEAQRERERSEYSQLTIASAWLPPLLAVLACGLQLTFWRNAVDGTTMILDGLLFIYPVRCLLEFRIDGRQSWLTKAALVFGLGMANHWLMILMLPFFLAALVWIKGVSFFNPSFLLFMFIAGLAGVAFCLLLPVMQSAGAGAPQTLGQAMHAYFAGQKNILLSLPYRSLWVLGLTSLLPVVILGIRRASSFGDNSPMGAALAAFMFHVVHGVFLVICLWGAFDSPLSPKAFVRQATDLHPYFVSQSWLPLYLLAALSVGYYSGYFLLVFNNRGRKVRYGNDFGQRINSLITGFVWVCVLLVPMGLIAKNWSPIRTAVSQTLAGFGRNLVENLPKQDAVFMSDDPLILSVAEATLSQVPGAGKCLFLNTAQLSLPPYHEFLRKKHPDQWTFDLGNIARTNQIPAQDLIAMVARQTAARELYYLHPSFGYYFEYYFAEPRGLVYRLQSYPTNALISPLPTPELAGENRAFWQRLDKVDLPDVMRKLPAGRGTPGFLETILAKVQARTEPDDQAVLVGAYYSRTLNYCGVIQQASGDLTNAAWSFHRAQDLNPLNVVAEINAGCNESLLAGGYKPADLNKGLATRISQYRDPSQMISVNGPFDEPRFCYQEGIYFTRAAHYRQAAWRFHRAGQLNPAEISANLWLAQIYNLWRQPDAALAQIELAREQPAALTNSPAELVTPEAIAYFTKGKPETAEHILQKAWQDHPDDQRLEKAVVSLLMNFQRPEAALVMVDRQLQQNPNDIDALVNKAAINLQRNQFAEAIPPLDHALQLQPDNYIALLNRAIALLQSGRLDDAQRDYETLALALPTTHQIYFGLGEIAHRRNDRNAAIANYEMYLKYAPANTEEYRMVSGRLAELKSAKP